MNNKGVAKNLRLCPESEDHSRAKLAEVVREMNHERSLRNWAYINCVTAYYDIHGLWIAVTSDGAMLGHGVTNLEAFEKAMAGWLVRWEFMNNELPNFRKVIGIIKEVSE